MSAQQAQPPASSSAASAAAAASSTWSDPPWSGWIETTGDALLILEAARRGLIPRVTRRLVDSERKMITSGSVFVFDEDESGIKRWTDGFFWSPSRILGNFLLYRETDKRGAGHRSARADQDAQDAQAAAAASYAADGARGTEAQVLSRPKTDSVGLSVDKQRERTLMGSLTNSYKFKPDGLMKKTFSVTIGGVAQHLISYYKIEDVENGRLRSPSSLPELASLDISPEYLDKTHFRNPPKVEYGADGVPRYRGEADDIENSPSILTAPLSSGMPLLTEGRLTDHHHHPHHAYGPSTSKRGAKRYDPYGSPKRARKNTGPSTTNDNGSSSSSSSSGSDTTPTAEPTSPQESAASTTPQPAAATPASVASASGTASGTSAVAATSTQMMTPAPYPPPYGMPAFYSMPPGYAHQPPPPGVYAQPGAASGAAPAGAGMHYAYAAYTPHAYPPAQAAPPSVPPTAPSAHQPEANAGSPRQTNAQPQAQAQATQTQVPAPAPAQQHGAVHRTDPSQSTPPPGPPGAAAPVAGQTQLPQPYYGYYHPHGPPPPPPGVNTQGHHPGMPGMVHQGMPHPGMMHQGMMHPQGPMGMPSGMGMLQGVPYASYQWPVYSGYPPPPMQPPQMQPPQSGAWVQQPGVMMQSQQPQAQAPAQVQSQKGEDGAGAGAGEPAATGGAGGEA